MLKEERLSMKMQCNEKLETMKRYDVTRISINPQSMNDDTLEAIGRGHNVSDVKEKFNLARKMGFNDINMDIIIGLPGEGLDCSSLPLQIPVHLLFSKNHFPNKA